MNNSNKQRQSEVRPAKRAALNASSKVNKKPIALTVPSEVSVQIGIDSSGNFTYRINGNPSNDGSIEVSKNQGRGRVTFSWDPQSTVQIKAFAVAMNPVEGKVTGSKLDPVGLAVSGKTVTVRIPSGARAQDEYEYSIVAFAAGATYSVDPSLRIFT